MPAIEWTQADIDALKTAIARGVRSVTYADRTVVYHSLAEMLQLLSTMAHAADVVPDYRLVAHSKGLQR